MAFIVRANEELGRLDKSSKIIKSNDFIAFKKSNKFISLAKERRKEIISASMAIFEEEQRRGYLEGRELAFNEQTEKMVEIVGQTVEYFSKIEQTLADLVMRTICRLIDDYDDQEKTIRVIRTSLSILRSQKTLQLHVNPENLEFVKSELEDLRGRFQSISQIYVFSDSAIDKDACIIDSEIGRVEASLSGQLKSIKSALKKIFGENVSEDF